MVVCGSFRKMKSPVFLAAIALVSLSAGGRVLAADPAAPLPRSAPEAQGLSSEAILRFIDTAETKIDALHGLVLIRHGKS